MSIDCTLSLPSNARIHAVAKALAALLGHPGERMMLPGTQGAWAARFPAVKLRAVSAESPDPSVAWIDIAGRLFLYHFESRGGRRGIMLSKTPGNICLLKALADFFGGRVDYDDCDEVTCNYAVADRSDEENCPEDGEPWTRLQERLLAIRPLSSRRSVATLQSARKK